MRRIATLSNFSISLPLNSRLETQLELLGVMFSSTTEKLNPTLDAVKYHVSSLSLAQRASISDVCSLLKLIYVTPATNAVSERSASVLRRVKTYLRSTMTQMRLNNIMILHAHKKEQALCQFHHV